MLGDVLYVIQWIAVGLMVVGVLVFAGWLYRDKTKLPYTAEEGGTYGHWSVDFTSNTEARASRSTYGYLDEIVRGWLGDNQGDGLRWELASWQMLDETTSPDQQTGPAR